MAEFLSEADRHLNFLVRCPTYEAMSKVAGISVENIREAVLSEIEDIVRQIESERKELNLWVGYEPKTDFFITKVPEVIGRGRGTIFALEEEKAAILYCFHVLETARLSRQD
jgi:hypothetical protein